MVEACKAMWGPQRHYDFECVTVYQGGPNKMSHTGGENDWQ